MGVPSVLFFDAQFLMEGSPVPSSPTVFSSASSYTSICSSDVSTAATTLACDAYVLEKSLHSPQEHQYPERLSLPQVKPTLPRPLHILPHTSAPPKSYLNTPSSTTSFSHRLDKFPAVPRHESQWPYGIDPSRLNKDLPELPKERKRVWRAIRCSVSHIFHRHHPKDTPRPASHITSGQAFPVRDPLRPNSAPLKPSSASVISSRPRPRTSSSSQAFVPGTTTHGCAQPSPAYIRKQQLRRSRSFSGYPVVLAGFADERRPPTNKQLTKECNVNPLAPDDDRFMEDEEMDEEAAEAFEILREIQKTWKFAPLNEDDPAFQDQDMYEHGVERQRR